jgi:CubicO group peptidase (beta-lactamase class C family)
MMKRSVNTLLFFTLPLLSGITSDHTKDNSIDELIGRYMTENHVPGLAYAVVGSNGIILSGEYGLANVEKNIPMGINSILNIASISRTITATAVMQLWALGQIDLEEDIADPYFLHPGWTGVC